MSKLYLIGSLRNKAVPELAARVRENHVNIEVFDDWYSAGPEADDYWKTYEQAKHGTDSQAYVTALNGYAAEHVFQFDKHHLDTATHALLVLPAGKSGHMEITYAAYGAGCNTAILLEEGADPRWDVMYKFIPNILTSFDDVDKWLAS